MKLKFLGTGTSQGVPIIGCQCPVCLSQDTHDRRTRTSALITTAENKKILIDCGPDFRQQMLASGEAHIDAVLVTHEHNDHVIGLDDMRPIIFRQQKNMALYASARTGGEIRQRFPYAFAEERYPGAPAFDLNIIGAPTGIEGILVEPLAVLHGSLPILGYKLGRMAYITDASSLPADTLEKIKNLDVLILNCLRKDGAHPSHFALPDILQLHNTLRPERLYLTHMSHSIGLHRDFESLLPEGIMPAFDGLEIECGF